ncbi:MAG: hypothetical protein Q4G33_14560 [bacterium]|nr:hypothetical protein [bacterium]
MKVCEFIAEFNNMNENDKGEFINNHIVTDYVPYEKKITICKNIIENTVYENRDIDGEIEKVFKINSCARYMYYVLWIIKLYTDIEIEFTDGEGLKAFNLLNKDCLIDAIIGMISEKEINEFDKILSMTFDDFLTNEHDIVSYIDNKLMNVRNLVNLFIGQLQESVTNMSSNNIVQTFNRKSK